jgi:ABC-2 type transport system ATP-binding protein
MDERREIETHGRFRAGVTPTIERPSLAEARRLTVRFGEFAAVDEASLSMHAGEVVGLLGANGAGKTTVIRALLGLLRPSSGHALLLGATPSRRSRQQVGYVPQSLGLYGDLTVADNWNFTIDAFGSRRPSNPLPEALTEFAHELVRDLSLGVQRRVAFAVAFSHRPRLLILDEPTSGVAPLNAARLWQDIRVSSEAGTGILVTTHNLEEAEQCDRLVVMASGQVVSSGTVGEVIAGREVIVVRSDDWQRAFALLDGHGLVAQVDGDALRVASDESSVAHALADGRLNAHLERAAASLEEAFVSIVSESNGVPE